MYSPLYLISNYLLPLCRDGDGLLWRGHFTALDAEMDPGCLSATRLGATHCQPTWISTEMSKFQFPSEQVPSVSTPESSIDI